MNLFKIIIEIILNILVYTMILWITYLSSKMNIRSKNATLFECTTSIFNIKFIFKI